MAGTTKLMTAGGGGVNLTPASSVASDVTVQIPAASGTVITTASSGKVIPTAALPAGTVLQVVQGTLTTNTVTTSTTDVSSGLTASITPLSSSNKILVLVNGGKAYISAGQFIPCTLYRNGVSLGAPARYTPAEGSPTASNHSMCYFDSPASTSVQTYTVYYRSSSGASAYFSDTPSATGQVSITLMEIAA